MKLNSLIYSHNFFAEMNKSNKINVARTTLAFIQLAILRWAKLMFKMCSATWGNKILQQKRKREQRFSDHNETWVKVKVKQAKQYRLRERMNNLVNRDVKGRKKIVIDTEWQEKRRLNKLKDQRLARCLRDDSHRRVWVPVDFSSLDNICIVQKFFFWSYWHRHLHYNQLSNLISTRERWNINNTAVISREFQARRKLSSRWPWRRKTKTWANRTVSLTLLMIIWTISILMVIGRESWWLTSSAHFCCLSINSSSLSGFTLCPVKEKVVK